MPARTRALLAAALVLLAVGIIIVVLRLVAAASPLTAAGLAAALGGPQAPPYRGAGAPAGGGPGVVIRGSGWGHSVGMSQYGAQAQALDGRGHEAILGHYYPGVELARHDVADGPIRVNLFLNQPDIDRETLRVQTASRDGRPPARPVTVDLGGVSRAVPFPQTWTLRHDGDAFVLRDADGAEQARGPGPVRLDYDHLEGNPTLLRLPQLAGRGGSRLAGTYQWGFVEVTRNDEGLRPVAVLPVELYLRGLAEMPAHWELEALKAQAVAGRTYAVRRVLDGLDDDCACHLGATPHDQVYAGWAKEGAPGGPRWVEAVLHTAGRVAMHRGELAWTYYSSSHGGRTERSADSWAYDDAHPYLSSVEDPWSLDPRVDNPKAHWERTVENAEFAAALGTGLSEVRGVRIVDRTDGGTPTELEIHGLDPAGRRVVHPFRGWRKAIAGSDLKLHFRSLLPSQQIEVIGLEPFRDDDGMGGEYEIAATHRAGIMDACDGPARRFCPHGQVTRGQAASFLARALGLDVSAQDVEAAGFGDVAHSPHAGAIHALASAGVVESCAAGRYCPDEPMTRGQAAEFVARAAERPAPDVSDPGEPVTRAGMARLLALAFDLGW